MDLSREPFWDDMAADLRRSGGVDSEAYATNLRAIHKSEVSDIMDAQQMFNFLIERWTGRYSSIIQRSSDTSQWSTIMLFFTLLMTLGTALYGYFMYVGQTTTLPS